MILNRTSKRQRTPVVNTLMRRKLSNYSLVHLFPTRAIIEKKKTRYAHATFSETILLLGRD